MHGYINKLHQRHVIILLTLIGIGAVLRFHNILWDEGYFFHPDERNIGYAISKLNFSTKEFNPQFWAYGSLPIYTIYLIAASFEFLTHTAWLRFESYLTIGRYISALCSVMLIPLTYLITRWISKKNDWSISASLIAALWVTFLPGMIQFAHFTTFETFLTLQYVLLLYLCFEIARSGKRQFYILAGIVLGLSVGTKIISAMLAPMIILSHFFATYHKNNSSFKLVQLFSINLIIAGVVTILAAVGSSPFHVLDWEGFKNSMEYEGGVANGTLQVFYTQQFIGTIPGLYQLLHVFPYILTIPLTIISFIAISYWGIKLTPKLFLVVKQKKTISPFDQRIVLTILLIVLYLAFNLSLFVKWTRYMVPLLPFLVILSSIFIFTLKITSVYYKKLLLAITSGWVILAGLSFWQIYSRPDPRTTAADWVSQHIDPSTSITSEIYDLGITAFSSIPQSSIYLAPLYDLENVPNRDTIIKQINQSDYFIILSERLWRNRLEHEDRYPYGSYLYRLLLQSDQWKTLFASHTRNVDCGLWTLYCMGGNILPDETFFVFDHPSLYILQNRF
ncbi:hypothetical protein HGA91_00665 [candidate division WWE3 bacterium]|nr:hypothetical protein [candidate division WWE3 bacterium]